MSKTTAPLLSFDARGQIAKSMVYSSWRGVKYARRHVIPANPQTTRQMEVRKTFALLREMWKLAPAILTAPWTAFAQGRPFTDMNKFVGENVRVLNTETDMANFIGSPGAKGGLPAADYVFDSPASDTATVTFTMPTPPTGWSITAAQAVAVPDQNPSGFFEGTIVAAEDTAGPAYVVTLSGLDGGNDYVVSAWVKWTKPDGSFAYSVSTSEIVPIDA